MLLLYIVVTFFQSPRFVRMIWKKRKRRKINRCRPTKRLVNKIFFFKSSFKFVQSIATHFANRIEFTRKTCKIVISVHEEKACFYIIKSPDLIYQKRRMLTPGATCARTVSQRGPLLPHTRVVFLFTRFGGRMLLEC